MPERINKLQPDRTVYLRGFDSFAAAASVHSASPDGFTVSGTFRDPADFAVVVLYDADNFFEHPSIKYLPDFNFAGLTLTFDLKYSAGLQPIDSPKFNWIDWATLDCIRADGSTAKIRLWDHATLLDATFPAASTTCTVTTGSEGALAFDRITLWYENVAFDYTVPAGSQTASFSFFAHGTGTAHSITVNGRTYSHTETNPLGESSAAVAAALAAAINGAGDPDVTASASSNAVVLTVTHAEDGVAIPVSASDGNGPGTLRYTSAAFVAAQIAAQINSTDWTTANAPHSLIAETSGAAITVTEGRYGQATVSGTSVTAASGTVFTGLVGGSAFFIAGTQYSVASMNSPTQLTLTAPGPTGTFAWSAPRGGYDGNFVQLYALATTGTLAFDAPTYTLTGGSSEVSWRCALDFSALGIDQLRQCWLTFAPALTIGPYAATEWNAVFSNWTLSGPDATKALMVAGPGSVRVEQSESACVYTGAWTRESGFYSKYFANVTSDLSAAVTVTYTCQFTHDLWIGTSLYSDRANAAISVDGDAETPLVCQLASDAAVITRRKARTSVAAGKHTVQIRPTTSGPFYFNFLEAAVAADVPNALAPRTDISPALDFDTDHTYKLPPARLMWILDQLGYAGSLNEYLGVFWWNERVLLGGSLSTAQVTFGGSITAGDTTTLSINGTLLTKTIFLTDTFDTVALHFAAFVNGAFTGVWASASGPVLTLTARSSGSPYTITVAVTGAATITTAPSAGTSGTWIIDDSIAPPINRAVRDWHADFYALCAARSREISTACSMELVNPPAGFSAKFPDGTSVQTSTSFGSLFSNHCAIGAAAVLGYQKAVYREIAALQTTAGLTPYVQYGEFLWWFLAGASGMAFYDAETTAAAETALGRALHIFTGQDDDPAINSSADALFLRNRLRDHVAALVSDLRSAYPTAMCEVLYPYDVNYPTLLTDAMPPIGGRLNRFVNLPEEWQTQATSGLDRMKVEALQFGAGLRTLDKANETIRLFPGFGWPTDRLRYLVPVFGFASPWRRELALAKGAGITTCNLWALDHVCLFNLAVPEGMLERRSVVKIR